MGKLQMKRAEKIVSVCVDGSLVAEYEEVTAELDALKKKRTVDKRMNDPATVLERRQAKLWEQSQAETASFRLRALPRSDWSKLRDEHPARKDNKLDEHFGFNTDTLFDAALSKPGVIVEVKKGGEVVEFSPEDWVEFAAELSVGQHVEFADAVKEINGNASSVPFSYAAYKRIQGSDAS